MEKTKEIVPGMKNTLEFIMKAWKDLYKLPESVERVNVIRPGKLANGFLVSEL
jgi:hypothetical protein